MCRCVASCQSQPQTILHLFSVVVWFHVLICGVLYHVVFPSPSVISSAFLRRASPRFPNFDGRVGFG